MSNQSTPSTPMPPPCLSCACGNDGFRRRRGLCSNCYQRANTRGTADRYPACGAVPVPCHPSWETFDGFPPGYTHAPTGWPAVPALIAPLHPPLPAATRWGHVVWFARPQHDPIGQALFDAATRFVEVETA